MVIGDLIFIKGKSWIDQEIEWITHSPYNHVCVYIGDGQCIEAQGMRTVGFRPLSYYPDYDVVPMNLNEDQQKRIMDYLYSQIGTPYDYLDILILFIRCTLKLKIPWHESHRLICSTLTRDALLYAGKRVPQDDNVTPEDLYEFYERG